MSKILLNLKNIKLTLGLILLVVIVVTGGVFVYQKFISPESQSDLEEVDLAFDAEGPYALLLPRRDGNALILSLKRTSSYDEISYELAYTSLVDEVVVENSRSKSTDDGEGGGESIDRGVVGIINVAQKKGEYEQEILFGTCSKNVCKYDKGVENGTLTLHIKKGRQSFRMITQWHLQKPDVALGLLTSGDGHFSFKTPAKREELAVTGFTIINDVTGVPKLPSEKVVLGKVYALNTPLAKDLTEGVVSIELAETPSVDYKIARFDEGQNKWEELNTKVEGSKLSAQTSGAGIFAVLKSK